MFLHLILITTCSLLWTPLYGADCPYKENQITEVTTGSVLPNQKEISFLNNPLTSIDDTAFDGSSNTLQLLRLSHSLFTRIPDAFTHLNAITDLSIAQVNIQDWNQNAMKNIGQYVEKLYLYDVGFKVWPDWIQFFSRITELIIVDSSISSLPDNALDTISNSLVSLSLNNNSFVSVPSALSNLASLQMLYLEENKIVDLTWLPKSSTLNSLYLTGNSIYDATHLSDALRPFADTLTYVDFQANQLTEIPRFDFLTKVTSLDLTKNKISDITSGSMPSSLYDLDLGYNYLSFIPKIMSSLNSLTDLRIPYNLIKSITKTDFSVSTIVIELQFNLITEISDSAFPENSSIRFIHLDNNPITHVSDVALKNVPFLEELYLSNTQLNRMPLGLSSLTSLTTLDLTSSRGLVCTCAEVSLRSLMLKLHFYNVKGNCGQTSIYTFFVTLSSECPS